MPHQHLKSVRRQLIRVHRRKCPPKIVEAVHLTKSCVFVIISAGELDTGRLWLNPAFLALDIFRAENDIGVSARSVAGTSARAQRSNGPRQDNILTDSL